MEKKLLIVDDDALLLEITKEYFNRLAPDIKVITTTSPRGALSIIREQAVHCTISDFFMPEMNGIELLEQSRKEGYQMPFIILTGHPIAIVEPLALGSGAYNCYQKNSSLALYEDVIELMTTDKSDEKSELKT